MLIAFSFSMLGFAFAKRISSFVVDSRLLSERHMTKIGTIYVGLVIFAVIILPKSFVVLWMSVFFPQLMFAAGVFSLVKSREARFRAQFRACVDRIVMKMKTGRSFRSSLDEVISESDPFLRARLSEIQSVVVFSQQLAPKNGDSFINGIVSELHIIDRAPHAAIRRLESLRERLRFEDEFRRKSGQALHQMRAQAVLLTGLYLAVAAFVLRSFGWRGNMKLIGISFGLFAIGVAWMFLGGGKSRWNV